MQCIYNYMPETNHVYRVHSVAAVMYLQFVLYVMLFHILNIFCTFILVLPKFVCGSPYGCLLLLLFLLLLLYLLYIISVNFGYLSRFWD